VLRCMTIWSCAQQPTLLSADGETYLVTGQWCWSKANTLLWDDLLAYIYIYIYIYIQGLRCDIQTNHIVCLRCISCWICAQHNMAMCMLILLLDWTSQWSSNGGCYPGYIYLALITTPCDELGKALLCQTEGFQQNYSCLSHALAVMWCASFQPVAWC
jgi:hypothetical protein